MMGRGERPIAPGADNIDDRLRLAEVHSAIEERDSGKLTRFRQSASAPDQILEDFLGDEWIAVAGNLGYFFSGIRMWSVKIGVEGIVDDGSWGIPIVSAHGSAGWGRGFLINFLQQGRDEGATQADDGDCRLTSSGGSGSDGILIMIGHPKKA
jgi:hypothetical protein